MGDLLPIFFKPPPKWKKWELHISSFYEDIMLGVWEKKKRHYADNKSRQIQHEKNKIIS